MASSTLCSETETEAGAGGGVLPTDAIYEILIRLPAEELCRLRVVCWPWRSLLSDPQFIAAHAARHHQRPLIVAAGHGKSWRGDCDILCRIIDLSGRVIKYIRWNSREDEQLMMLMSTLHNLACFGEKNSMRCQVLNLVTGERFALPEELSQEHAVETGLPEIKFSRVSIAFGLVASTGEFKFIRVLDDKSIYHYYYRIPSRQLCEVLTLGGGSRDDAQRWRGKKAAQGHVHMSPLTRVALDGVVYFLLNEYVGTQDDRPKGIASFDLLKEEWRAILRGPVSILAKKRHESYDKLSLVALNLSLVLVHCTSDVKMDLWFLIDFEKGLWVKQHTVVVNLSFCEDGFLSHPLMILKNGSIVIYIGSRRLLRIYNPRTNTCTHVAELLSSDAIGLYTGNLLSIANDAT